MIYKFPDLALIEAPDGSTNRLERIVEDK